jgi:hypothetical protein
MGLTKAFERERVPVRWRRHATRRAVLVCHSGTGEHTNVVTMISAEHVTRFLRAQDKEAEKLAELRAAGGW